MNLPAGKLASRDCAAKCVAKPCSKRTCGGRIKKDPLNKGTEIVDLVHILLTPCIKKDPLNKGTEIVAVITHVFVVMIKKDPLNKGTETRTIYSCLSPHLPHKKRSPE